jgi:hypothetical protein
VPAPEIVIEQPAGTLAGATFAFGNQFTGSNSQPKVVTIKNTGLAPLTISSVSRTGGNTADFSLNLAGMLTNVPAGGQTTFAVTFNPAAPGARATTLTILCNDADEGTNNFALTGTGLGLPKIAVEQPAGTPVATTNTFGNQNTGSNSAAKIFTIKNTGAAALLISSVSTTNGFTSEFAVNLIGTLTSIPAGGQTTFTVTFNPAGLGLRTTTLRILNSDAGQSTTDILLLGTGTTTGAPVIVIEQPAGTPAGSTVAFGNQNRGTASPAKTFVIKNTGTADLNLSGVSLTNTNAADFTVNFAGILPTIPAGSQTTFTVTFTPAALGSRTNTLRVLNSDTNKSTADILLTGTGLGAPAIVLEQPLGTPLAGSYVAGWGNNVYGQTNVPAGLSGVTAITAGLIHSVALKSDGSAVAWGYNGDGETNVPVEAKSGVIAISSEAQAQWTMALKTNGTVVGWTYNGYGQCTPPAGLTGVTKIAAGSGHALALKADGTVAAWGNNDNNQTNVPAGLNGVTAVAGGDFFSLALKSNGTVVAWGNNTYGQTNVPANVTNIIAIAGGSYQAVGLQSNGTLVAWGRNAFGATSIPAGLTNVTKIATGGFHTMALKSDGTVAAWGYNAQGQTDVPVGLSGVTDIATGYEHSLALVSSTIAFGNQNLGTTSAALAVTIRNTGTATLNISGVNTTGGNSGDFAVNTNGMLLSVPASGVRTFTVTFSPALLGFRATTLRVLSDDTNKSVITIALTGTGTAGSLSPFPLTNPARLPNGSFHFAFTNSSGLPFTVLTSTNVALPLTNWSVLGVPIEGPLGQYQFTDPQATNSARRFYRVRSP